MKQLSKYVAVLDASALLASLAEEPGHEGVDSVLGTAVISAVNLAEVQAKLIRRSIPLEPVQKALAGSGLVVEPFTEADATASALLYTSTQLLGLSLGDRACLALGRRLNLPVITTDRAWLKLRVGIQVQAIR